MSNKKFKKQKFVVSSAFHPYHHQFPAEEKDYSRIFYFFREREREREREYALSHTVQYFKYFIIVTYLTVAITTVLNNIVLLLAIFVNVLIFTTFKLNCMVGMYEY